MRLQVLRSLWTNGYDLHGALADCASGRYDGIEGPVPAEPERRRRFLADLRSARDGLEFVSEIVTGGGYVPSSRDPEHHLGDLRTGLERGAPAGAVHHNVLFGSDAWPPAQRVDVLGRALEIIAEHGVPASFETHRSRVTFNPWDTAALLRELPELHLTCDFSHWCAVAERLVLDDDDAGDLLALFAERAAHVHARVGYAHGPQVPHPAAPAYADALSAHERWWRRILDAQAARGGDVVRFTCEFGPDGYQQSDPVTGATAATLDELNAWMADRLRAALDPSPAPLPAAS